MKTSLVLAAAIVFSGMGIQGCKRSSKETSATQPPRQSQASTTTVSFRTPESQAVTHSPAASINEQIEQFNSTRSSDMGISPIDRRVLKVIYDASTDSIKCFDKEDALFLTLGRQEDRSFKGNLEVKYHQLADPTTRYSWGHVIAEFHLPSSVVGLLKPTTP